MHDKIKVYYSIVESIETNTDAYKRLQTMIETMKTATPTPDKETGVLWFQTTEYSMDDEALVVLKEFAQKHMDEYNAHQQEVSRLGLLDAVDLDKAVKVIFTETEEFERLNYLLDIEFDLESTSMLKRMALLCEDKKRIIPYLGTEDASFWSFESDEMANVGLSVVRF